MTKSIPLELIAPCGMNCNLCSAFLREEKYIVKCPGCRADDHYKPRSCAKCIINHCEILKQNQWQYCSSQCPQFACNRLKNIDRRYRTKYGMSMIDNLNDIEKRGIRAFIAQEEKKWIKGDQIFCVHKKVYF